MEMVAQTQCSLVVEVSNNIDLNTSCYLLFTKKLSQYIIEYYASLLHLQSSSYIHTGCNSLYSLIFETVSVMNQSTEIEE